ncbi:MAG: ABC-F family ATP-binding cassette domain-containing protein, partial [Pseudobdellovibrionaceae bacterium]
MAVLISANKISKSYGAKTLFRDLTFSIESSQKIGLIGPNGAGKSSLLQILAKQQKADAGQVSFSTGLRLGYLAQNPEFQPDDEIFTCLLNATDDPYDNDNIVYVSELISKLDLDSAAAGSDRKISELSGGWRKRVALARELAKKPNLLLLDEPTNHLDVLSIFWIEEFLAQQDTLAVLTVTHDRLFLQKTCDMIFDLDPRNPDGLIKSKGSYSDYVLLKEQLLDAQKKLEDVKKNTFRRETEWLRRGQAGRHTKQTARINRAHSLGDEVDALQDKNRVRVADLEFTDVARAPKKMIEASHISKQIGPRFLFKDFSCLISPRARFGILGENGCGKSTLLRTLIGEQQPDVGSVFVNEDIKISYFEQQKDSLDPNLSVMKTICPE